MDWSDIYDIAAGLCEEHPDVDPQFVRFTDLMTWVLELEGFDGDADRCGEKILEAIQMAWLEEMD